MAGDVIDWNTVRMGGASTGNDEVQLQACLPTPPANRVIDGTVLDRLERLEKNLAAEMNNLTNIFHRLYQIEDATQRIERKVSALESNRDRPGTEAHGGGV